MKDIVRLKSYPNGIRIVIAEDALFGDVLAEVSEKFKDSERFFGKAKLAVTFEGRKNTQEEEDAILDTIRQESSVNIVCVVEKEKEESLEKVKELLCTLRTEGLTKEQALALIKEVYDQ